MISRYFFHPVDMDTNRGISVVWHEAEGNIQIQTYQIINIFMEDSYLVSMRIKKIKLLSS